MPLTDEEFERWRSRVLSVLLALICVGALVNEFFLESRPREQVILAAFSFLGFPIVLEAARGKKGGK